MQVRIFTTGGTIDKVYFDAKSEYTVGESLMSRMLGDANVTFDYGITELMRKDSLDLDVQDRERIRAAVMSAPETQVLITHGTDTMVETARALTGISDKTIVLVGAMSPARFQNSDAVFNIGCAIGAMQCLNSGVYVVMNGRIFPWDSVRKNREIGRFERV